MTTDPNYTAPGSSGTHAGVHPTRQPRTYHTQWHAEITGIAWESRRCRGNAHPPPPFNLRLEED